ncbi:MAG: DUF3783 domain-containing protein [Calditrichaeota bacterium]|nr:DUF3783 domain-containing protein [Calditrichota bacterium]
MPLVSEHRQLLLGGFTDHEKAILSRFVEDIEFPPIMEIEPNQSGLTIAEIVKGKKGTGEGKPFTERFIIFYNFQRPEISAFISVYKTLNLPRPLFAAVTPYSMKWSLEKLLHDLVEERRKLAAQKRKTP